MIQIGRVDVLAVSDASMVVLDGVGDGFAGTTAAVAESIAEGVGLGVAEGDGAGGFGDAACVAGAVVCDGVLPLCDPELALEPDPEPPPEPEPEPELDPDPYPNDVCGML
jgi:hypothetical protein